MEAANGVSLNLAQHRLIALANQPLAIFSFCCRRYSTSKGRRRQQRPSKFDCSSKKATTGSVLPFLSSPKVQQTLNVDWICPHWVFERSVFVFLFGNRKSMHYFRGIISGEQPPFAGLITELFSGRCAASVASRGWAVRSVKQLPSQQRAAARTRIK